MRLLLTSDSQAERSNLDLCEIALEELLRAADKYKPDAIIHAGDLKDPYSPVDVPVYNFWVRATQRIVKAGWNFYCNLGNHDRISQSLDSRNWFPVLRAAGAKAITKPTVKKIGNGYVAFCPFTADKKQEYEWYDQLSKEIQKHQYEGPKVLVFHGEVAGANMGAVSSLGIDPSDMHCNEYDICLGGHLHERQHIEPNIHYIGSPFCQDWSEANQRKGIIFLEVENNLRLTVTLKQLKTAIPGFYDSEWLVANKFAPESGAYIRSRVPVTSKKITQQLRNEEERLAGLYPEARLHVIPKLQASEKLEVPITGQGDLQAVEQYVSSTIQDGVKFDASRVVAYLASKLHKIDPGASGKQLKFIKTEATNVLVFPFVQFRYDKQGLVLLKGVNKDWPKKSNGSGKTSLLSLLLIALFGETLKEQRNDDWASERTSDPAEIILWLRDEQNRKIKIVRGRRKHKILLYLNGDDISSGITGKRKGETQGQIEELTGYDLRMLLNSVYIDQTVANGFVFGTQKDRMDLINKLQNLGRYDAASKLVAKDMKKGVEALATENARIDYLEEEVSRLEQELDDALGQVGVVMWHDEYKKARHEVNRLTTIKADYANSADFYRQLQREWDELQVDVDTLSDRCDKLAGDAKYWEKRRITVIALREKGICTLCEQPTITSMTDVINLAVSKEAKSRGKLAKARDSLKAKDTKIETVGEKIRNYHTQIKQNDLSLGIAREHLKHVQSAHENEQARAKKEQDKCSGIKKQLKHSERILKASRNRIKELGTDIEMLEYAMKAFHRSGMPLYLSAALCPLLNKAAEEYAEIFTEGKLNIEFAVIDGEFTVSILNPAGSETSKGQSMGESAMAGLIAAFALREAAPKTNLLILDEPASGLDPESAKQFAKGLLRLKDRYETVIVTTHSPIIEGLLAGETTWVVTKKNGQSELSI